MALERRCDMGCDLRKSSLTVLGHRLGLYSLTRNMLDVEDWPGADDIAAFAFRRPWPLVCRQCVPAPAAGASVNGLSWIVRPLDGVVLQSFQHVGPPVHHFVADVSELGPVLT
jgi:hypothetical protein